MSRRSWSRAQGRRCIVDRQACEVPEFDQSGSQRFFSSEPGKRSIQIEQFVPSQFSFRRNVRQFNPAQLSPAFVALLPTGPINEDTPHGLRRGSEEVSAVVELLIADQSQIRFMNQSGCIQRVIGSLDRQLRCGEDAKFVVDEREQPGGGLAITGRRRFQL